MAFEIRDATPDDAQACATIYRPYVESTAITFEIEPPGTEEMRRRIAESQERHAWLVLVEQGDVVGYAFGHAFKTRPAYAWSAEVSVYIHPTLRRTGAGRALYRELLPRLAARGIRTVVAGIALPNAASLGLHSSLGFEPVGTLRRIGWKLGDWHDVAWMQRRIGDETDSPDSPPREHPQG